MMTGTMDKAVILARGLGTRMRKDNHTSVLTGEQDAAADEGVKAMIPTGRPFLDYVLTALADAGYKRICLVIGPEHDGLRDYYGRELEYKRLSVEFAVQEKPLGTADAVAAAEEFAAGESVLVINSDNYYPVEALGALRNLDGCGLAAFDRDGLLSGGNIPLERVAKFAVVELDDDGCLTKIHEKPDDALLDSLPAPLCVSMNCWRFDASIYAACREIAPSPRGELEVPDAVQLLIDRDGRKFHAPRFNAPVLDLTSRADIAPVAQRLSGVEVCL